MRWQKSSLTLLILAESRSVAIRQKNYADRMLLRAQIFGRLAPVQLAPQHGEVIVIIRVQQPHSVRGPADGDAIAFG